MIDIYDVLTQRGVNRLCHFTKIKSLIHIFSSEDGILASDSIRPDVKSVIDTERYDGELDYICCSVEYPNSWFLNKAKRDNSDKIFNDWCVIYIDLDILKIRRAKCCPCNASTCHGKFIGEDAERLFEDHVEYKMDFFREKQMLKSCPTDSQAEILIRKNIPCDRIIGIALGTENEAKRVYAIMKTLGVSEKPLYIAPDVLTTQWSALVRRGERPFEELCQWEEE